MVDPLERDPLQDLVRGRLSQDEAARLEAKISADPAMEADRRLVAALNETDAAVHDFPHELGWARLSASIDREKPPALWQRTVSLWQVAALLAIAVFGWQLAVAPHLVGTAEPGYVTATGSGGETIPGTTLRVAFAPTGTERAIRELLREAGARIVDGPTAVGLYTIAFGSRVERDAGASILGKSADLVEVINIK